MTKRRPGRKATPQDVALRLARSLPKPSALIGALAVTAHGYVRATDDVDFVSPADATEIRKRLKAAGIRSRVRRGNELGGDIRSVVYGMIEGIRFDVLFPPVPIDWSQTVVLPLGDGSLRVVDLDGLIRLKLRAGGPQDLIDVVQLLRRHPEALGKALGVADAYGLRERLSLWLADPRIRSPDDVPPLSLVAKAPSKRPRRS